MVQENEWKKVMKKRVVECEIIQGREGCLSWRGGNRNRKVDTHSWGRTKSVYKWLWLGASFKHLGNGGSQSSNNSVPEKLETGDRCWTSLSSSEAPETAPAREELPRLDPGHGVLRQISEEKRFKKNPNCWISNLYSIIFLVYKNRFPFWVGKEKYLKSISHSICHCLCFLSGNNKNALSI